MCRTSSVVLDNHRPVLAERYKTKLCKTFMDTGACIYEHRCMFAHGEFDLRTKEMNIRDGLVRSDALKMFQKGMQLALKAAAENRPIEHHELPESIRKQTPPPQKWRHNPYAFVAFDKTGSEYFASGSETRSDSQPATPNYCEAYDGVYETGYPSSDEVSPMQLASW